LVPLLEKEKGGCEVGWVPGDPWPPPPEKEKTRKEKEGVHLAG